MTAAFGDWSIETRSKARRWLSTGRGTAIAQVFFRCASRASAGWWSRARLADDGVAKIGTLLEHLSSRFDLVVEAVSGFGGRLDSLREEILSQFAEVGQQIRFLCDQIADGQNKLTAVHGDVTAELVRLGEALGAARIEVRQGLAGLGDQVNGNREHLEQSVAELRSRLAATPAPS